jgi:GT2 family glycosyltransferase
MTKLVISIVTWNSSNSIKECVESVLRQGFKEYSLFIVDNASMDNTLSIVSTIKDERIQIISLKENTGFCGGHNYVLNHSQSDFVLLVNPDIILSPNYVELALQTMQNNNKIGTVCGLLLQSPKEDPQCTIDSAGLNIMPSRIMSLNHHGEKLFEAKLKTEEVFGADGALPLYRREMINNVSINGQFFDNMFFAHKEDWDVSWRSAIYGWKTIFNPMCVAIHPRVFKPGNLKLRKNMPKQIKIDAVKNQLILLAKNESAKEFFTHFLKIVPRQIIIFFYILFFENSSLKAYSFFFKNRKQIFISRKIIQQNRKVSTI